MLLRTALKYMAGFAVAIVFLQAAWAQSSTASSVTSQTVALTEAVKELQRQVIELRAAVAEVHAEAEQYRKETLALRRELESRAAQTTNSNLERSSTAGAYPPPAPQEDASTSSPQSHSTAQNPQKDRIGKLEEEYQLLTGELAEQYQTKVESASRYRVRLSGVGVFNLFSNFGTVNNVDLPSFAEETPPGQTHGSSGATFRQSQLGLSVMGPEWKGARTGGDIQFDFAGGFPNSPNGEAFGMARLRTGTVRLDWANTSLIAGQDAPLFSPLSPTSVATLATPALAYMGNLWTWVPQVRVEHRIAFSESSKISISAGVFDSATGQLPSGTFYRAPQAGESSRQPGYGTRLAWTSRIFGRDLALGAGGYYGRQDWGFGRNVDSWAGTADWSIPLTSLFSVQGEFYRGRGLGGFGAANDRSVVLSGPPDVSTSQIRGLDVIGGWSQLKFQPRSKLEFNLGYGLDNPFTSELREFSYGQSSPYNPGYLDTAVGRNSGYMFNTIYRPRSDLLFSLEYRQIHTFDLNMGEQHASQVNLVMGVLF